MVRRTAVTMNLPSELLLETMQYLSKADLKNARLVSRIWAGCASDRLFAKLFISPHSLNLQIFVTIAANPDLSNCVKELEYDAIHFWPDITVSGYIHLLWGQTEKTTLKRVSKFTRSDPEIKEFVAMLRRCTVPVPGSTLRSQINNRAEAQKQCIDFDFIQEGYRKWIQEAHIEKENSDEPNFSKAFIAGLKNLTRLRTVKLRAKWPSEGKVGLQGSPLARSWHPLHAQPPGWAFSPRFPLALSSTIIDYRYLTSALTVAGRTGVRNLSIKNPTPPYAFIDNPNKKQSILNDCIVTYSGLEKLKLSLARSYKRLRTEPHDDLRGVQSMLESMRTLKRLELDLPNRFEASRFLFLYTKVFPENGHWPLLTAFKVHNLAISTKDLMTLLVMRMPSLRHLDLGIIELLDGTWEAIVEYLKISQRLSSFHIGSKALLYHCGDQVFYPLDSSKIQVNIYSRPINYRIYMESMRSIMDYVNNGRDDSSLRHPSLSPNQSAQESIAYLSHISSLYGLHSMEDLGDAIEEPIHTVLEETVRRLYTKGEV